jgi:hypothetical protein
VHQTIDWLSPRRPANLDPEQLVVAETGCTRPSIGFAPPGLKIQVR